MSFLQTHKRWGTPRDYAYQFSNPAAFHSHLMCLSQNTSPSALRHFRRPFLPAHCAIDWLFQLHFQELGAFLASHLPVQTCSSTF